MILTYDAVLTFDFDGHVGMGLGTLVLIVNAILIWGYTLGCHPCRHIVGGRLRAFSRHPLRYRLWGWVSTLSGQHMWRRHHRPEVLLMVPEHAAAMARHRAGDALADYPTSIEEGRMLLVSGRRSAHRSLRPVCVVDSCGPRSTVPD